MTEQGQVRVDKYVMSAKAQSEILKIMEILDTDLREQVKGVDDQTAALFVAQVLNKFSMTLFEKAQASIGQGETKQ